MAWTRILGNNISTTTKAIIKNLNFFSASGILSLPVGTTAQRPTGISFGTIRYNTTKDTAEIYNTQTGIADWNGIGSETGVDGGDAYIRTNGTTITKNITIGPTANSDQKYTYGFLTGDITIDTGITVDIETGAGLIIIDEVVKQNFDEDIDQSGLQTWLDAGNKNSYSGSGTLWKDLASGSQYTINGGIEYITDSQGVFKFNGSNTNVSLLSSSVPAGNQITFGVWIYGTVNKASSIIEARTASGNRTLNVHLTWSDGTVYFDSGNDSASNRLSKNATNLEYLGWHYWTFTKDATTGSCQIYLDGGLWIESSGNTAAIGSTATVRVGSYADNTTYHQGYVSNLHIYSRRLTASEILNNYNVIKPRFIGSLVT